MYVNDNDVTYSDSFGIEHIAKEIKKITGIKNITNAYRIQPYASIMCGYFCIGFIDLIWKGKSWLEYTNLFSPNDYEKNDKIMVKYFSVLLVLSVVCSKCKNEDEKVFKEEGSIAILKILSLVNNIEEYQKI